MIICSRRNNTLVAISNLLHRYRIWLLYRDKRSLLIEIYSLWIFVYLSKHTFLIFPEFYILLGISPLFDCVLTAPLIMFMVSQLRTWTQNWEFLSLNTVLTIILMEFFLKYWDLNSEPTPWVTPQALFYEGFF
jgi:hypothetical protein